MVNKAVRKIKTRYLNAGKIGGKIITQIGKNLLIFQITVQTRGALAVAAAHQNFIARDFPTFYVLEKVVGLKRIARHERAVEPHCFKRIEKRDLRG